MKIPRRLQFPALAAAAATFASIILSAQSAAAQTVTAVTDPVGFAKVGAYDPNSGNYLGLLGNSDTFVSLPFTRPPEFIGSIASVNGSVVNIAGSPNFTSNQFGYPTTLPAGYTDPTPPRYYALIGPNSTTNPKEGSLYTIVTNDAGTLTLDLNGDSLASVAANTQILVIPYWTLGTVFPDSDANVSFVPSSNGFNRQMDIYIPNLKGAGFNLSTSIIYYYINDGTGNIGWRRSGRPATVDHSIDAFTPNAYFTVRNNTANAKSFTLVGSVLTKKLTTPLATQVDKQQDNFLAIERPVPTSLNQSGLFSSGAFSASTSVFNRTDELYVFDNAAQRINKSTASIYYYINNMVSGQPNVGWRKAGGSQTQDVGDLPVLEMGSGFIVRKGVSDGFTRFWTNAPNY